MDKVISFWNTVKQTLLEKNGDSIMGSIKRWGAWILFFYAGEIVNAGLLPGGSIHLGTFLNLQWKHSPINLDALKVVLEAIGTYILTGQALSQITDTIQNYHNVKNPPPSTPKQ